MWSVRISVMGVWMLLETRFDTYDQAYAVASFFICNNLEAEAGRWHIE